MVYNTTAIDTVVSVANKEKNAYRRCFMSLNDVANVAGSGAGASVALDIDFVPPLPEHVLDYAVHVTPNQDAVAFVTNKTNSGFTLTLNPRLAANTLSLGASDILITWDQDKTA